MRINHFKQAVLRTSLLPINSISELNENKLIEIASNEEFQEAISLSSYDFYNRLKKWLNTDKEYNKKETEKFYSTIYKYAVRAATRATPFGKFGSVSHIDLIQDNLSETVSLEIDSNQVHFTKIDTRLLFKLIKIVEEEIGSDHLVFYLNNSIYKVGDEMRYYEMKKNVEDIYYQLSKFQHDEIIGSILDLFREGSTIEDVLNNFESLELDRNDLFDFITQLIDEKIILSELHLDYEYFNCTSKIVKHIHLHFDKKKEDNHVLNSVKKIFDVTNSSLFSFEKIDQISCELDKLGIQYQNHDIIHCDTKRKTRNSLDISTELQKELFEVRDFLLGMHKNEVDPLESFKLDFFKRFEYRPVGLLELLDTESGLGFHFGGQMAINPVTRGIHFPFVRQPNKDISLSRQEGYLLKKLIECKGKELEIMELDFREFAFNDNIQASNSFNAFFTLLNDSIFLNSFSGSSSLKLISRFSHCDIEIEKLCKLIAVQEEKMFGNQILAEITHIPELKSTNLFASETFRNFEISCVTQTMKENVIQIPLSDLFVRLRSNNKIELFSKNLKKIVEPKLSNSLNFRRNSIPIYHFLCLLESQNKCTHLSFEWNRLLDLFEFLPRVTYKNIILSPKTWRINYEELNNFCDDKEKIENWRENRGINKLVFLLRNSNDDNRLLIDFDNWISVKIFLTELRKFKNALLIESFINENSIQVSNGRNVYSNEIILPCFDNSLHFNVNNSYDFTQLLSDQKKHVFTPGSEWMSFKIYMGYKSLNSLMVSIFLPVLKELVEENITDKWFFVRYFDDGFHLRLRVHMNDFSARSFGFMKISTLFQELYDSGVINNILVDTYKRENERYDHRYIDTIETLFYHDSVCISKYLKTSNSESSIGIFALLGIESILSDFQLSLDEKHAILKSMYEAFFNEFHGNSELKRSLDHEYRKVKKEIFYILDKKTEVFNLIEIIESRSKSNKKLIFELWSKGFPKGGIDEYHTSIIVSIVHMFMNRLFESQNRKSELVIYYQLYQYFKSKCAIGIKSELL